MHFKGMVLGAEYLQTFTQPTRLVSIYMIPRWLWASRDEHTKCLWALHEIFKGGLLLSVSSP